MIQRWKMSCSNEIKRRRSSRIFSSEIGDTVSAITTTGLRWCEIVKLCCCNLLHLPTLKSFLRITDRQARGLLHSAFSGRTLFMVTAFPGPLDAGVHMFKLERQTSCMRQGLRKFQSQDGLRRQGRCARRLLTRPVCRRPSFPVRPTQASADGPRQTHAPDHGTGFLNAPAHQVMHYF